MKIKIFRRITQALTILLIIAMPLMNKKGIAVITGSLYSLSIDGIWITDPLSGFQVIVSTLSANTTLILSMLIPISIALVFGRIFCSWMCPQNSISELFDYIARRLFPLLKWGKEGLRLFNLSPSAKPRYAILIALFALTPLLGFPVANLISSPGIISVQITKYFYEGIVGIELGLIGIIVVLEVFFVRRLWCNYICPVGSFLGIFRSGKTMKVVYSEDAEHLCGRCMECVDVCQLGLNPMGGKVYPLCHNCGDCIVKCEKIKGKGKPLSFKM